MDKGRKIKSCFGWLTRLSIWPVVQRELREGARRPVNHRLRLFSGVGGTVLLAIIAVNSRDSGTRAVGAYLLVGLHSAVMGLIFLTVTASAADCIARERREGTLGLLFLTPLSASGIVAGKALVQGLRAMTLWLAVLPLLTVPFLAGGAGWYDALSALSMEFSAAVLCLAAGLLASSLARERNKVFLLAFIFAGLFLFVFSAGLLAILVYVFRGSAAMAGFPSFWYFGIEAVGLVCGTIDGEPCWGQMAAFSPTLGKTWERLCWGGLAAAVVVFFLVSWFAAARIKRSWRDKPPTARSEKLRRRYCTPLFQERFRRNTRRALERNPIAWLQEYSWKARVSKWLLFVVFFVVCYESGDSRGTILEWLLVILGGFYVFAGVSGFLEDKRNGALEMLLVTPVSPAALIFGRAWGMWKRFLPAAAVLAVFYIYESIQNGDPWPHQQSLAKTMTWLFALGCGFMTLPIFATYFALRVKNLLAAGAWTLIAVFVPFVMANELGQMFVGFREEGNALLLIPILMACYGIFVYLTCRMLRHSLARRIYAF